MNDKIKNIIIPFILMLGFYLTIYYSVDSNMYGAGINVYLGILFISGLFFGPYGCLSAAMGNYCCDVIVGYDPVSSFFSMIISYCVSYLAYKLWYTRRRNVVITKPRINTVENIFHLLEVIFVFSLLYSILTAALYKMVTPTSMGFDYLMGIRYFANCVNFSLLFSVGGMTIARYHDFMYTPQLSTKNYDEKEYTFIACLLAAVMLFLVINSFIGTYYLVDYILMIVTLLLIVLYSRKPIKEVTNIKFTSIPERIMGIFVVMTLIVTVIHFFVLSFDELNYILNILEIVASNQEYLLLIMFLDFFVILFFFPALFMLRYVEKKLIKPITEFSKIENYIKVDEKIETDSLLNVYSKYTDQDDEIGILSRSYTDLITNSNKYVENLKTLEGEKQRIKTELNIAHNIQAAILPRSIIDDDYITLKGYSLPAKEVGGDFYDYYQLDEDNTVVIIGDASGKGVPAAILSIITQNSIKLLIKNEKDPAKVLYEINNQLFENNSEFMFITLFLAIYNKKSHVLTYANAGHNLPIIKNNGVYENLTVDSAIALGVMKDFEFKNGKVKLNEELFIYTDGITDAINENEELYGEGRLLDFLNNEKDNNDIIHDLNENIQTFCGNMEQFDDMTSLWLKIKK